MVQKHSAHGFAIKNSIKFVELVEGILSWAGHAEFWNEVKTTACGDRNEDQYMRSSIISPFSPLVQAPDQRKGLMIMGTI
jgi:hypothetical protein